MMNFNDLGYFMLRGLGSPYGVMVKVLDNDIVVSEFKPESRH